MGLTFDFNQVYEKIEDMSNKMQNETLDKALEAGSKPIIKSMEQNVLVDTGLLKSDLGEIKKTGSADNRKIEIGIKSNDRKIVERGYYAEYGNECQAASHWMKKSFNNSNNEAVEEIKKTLKSELNL